MTCTVNELLKSSGLGLAEARLLLADQLGVPREWLIAHPDQGVESVQCHRFDQQAARRRKGEPIAYLIGRREFYGRGFQVTPDVLIPRPETETLVDLALEHLASIEAPRVLELGTGSGCIAITLALERPDVSIVGTDISAQALDVARANGSELNADVRWIHSDWYAELAGEAPFDLIVSNPPYVSASDPHLVDLSFEPREALTDGGDGLRCLATVIAGAPSHLRKARWLILEHGYDQAANVRHLLAAAGFESVGSRRDAAGIERVSFGRS